MRHLKIRVYPYPDVHPTAQPATGLPASWIAAITQRLPPLFRIQDPAIAEQLEASSELRLGCLASRPSSSKLTHGDLMEDLAKLIDAELADHDGGEPWTARILLAQSHALGLTTYGAMFDVGTGASPARRGCAVFLKAVRDFTASTTPNAAAILEELFVRTLGHEVGHLVNLCHDPPAATDLMSEGRPDDADLANQKLSADNRRHLLLHPEDAVRPGSTIAYGSCPQTVDHTSCQAGSGAPLSSARPSKVQLELMVHPGLVYTETAVPTLVIGEPLCLTATVVNQSKRLLRLPASPAELAGKLRLFRHDGYATEPLVPPAISCSATPMRARPVVRPGERLEIHQVVTYRSGQVVFPKAGQFRLTAWLRVGARGLYSNDVTVHVSPPLRTRHELYCDLATRDECASTVELAGARMLEDRDRPARRLLAQAPDYPLADHIRLAAARAAVRTGRAPYGSWRSSLERVIRNPRLPGFLKDEARALMSEHRSPTPTAKRTKKAKVGQTTKEAT